jgi:hypothetical protein
MVRTKSITPPESFRYVIVTGRLPEFRTRTCTNSIPVPAVVRNVFNTIRRLVDRIPRRLRPRLPDLPSTINVRLPCVQSRRSRFTISTQITIPEIVGRENVRAIVNDCANKAKDEAVTQLLIGVALASASGGTSIGVALQQSVTTFRSSFQSCIESRLEGIRVTFTRPTISRTPVTDWRRRT